MQKKKIRQKKDLHKKAKKLDKQKGIIDIKGFESLLDAHYKKIIKKESHRREAVKGTVFLATFLILFGIFNLLINTIPNFVFSVENFIASLVLTILKLQGFEGSIVFVNEIPVIELLNGVKIQISYLCTGLMEASVLLAAILASHGIPWNKRIVGSIAGILIVQVFNIVRILLTILFIMGSDIETIEFVHNVFFRVTLFLAIVGIYATWFWVVTRKAT